MNNKILSNHMLSDYRAYLIKEEKSTATIEKYLRDAGAFLFYAGESPVTKEVTIAYKKNLLEKSYAATSVNSMLASINSLFCYLGWEECKVKFLKLQKKIYCSEKKELTKEDYMKLLTAAKGQKQLSLIMQTICCTGIRISELKYFTVEAVKRGEIVVRCKSKTRIILVPNKLKKKLLNYASSSGIKNGSIFVSRNGKPLDRSNIWARMKNLCKDAQVEPDKVFPHNLRKLFAKTFYKIEKDIAKLADILGHGSIETTRIYIMTTGMEHRRKIERLNLVI